MSIVGLSEATAALGLPLNRMTIGNLENGHRESVSAAEIAVLAGALNVAPILLVLPIGRENEAEVLPGQTVSMSDAYRWIVGTRSLRTLQEDTDPTAGEVNRRYNATSHAIGYLSMHDRAYFKAYDLADEDAVRALWELRGVMAQQGIVLPRIDDQVARALQEFDR